MTRVAKTLLIKVGSMYVALWISLGPVYLFNQVYDIGAATLTIRVINAIILTHIAIRIMWGIGVYIYSSLNTHKLVLTDTLKTLIELGVSEEEIIQIYIEEKAKESI